LQLLQTISFLFWFLWLCSLLTSLFPLFPFFRLLWFTMAPPWFIRDSSAGSAFLTDLGLQDGFVPSKQVYKALMILAPMCDQANGAQPAPRDGKTFPPSQPEFWTPSPTIVGLVPPGATLGVVGVGHPNRANRSSNGSCTQSAVHLRELGYYPSPGGARSRAPSSRTAIYPIFFCCVFIFRRHSAVGTTLSTRGPRTQSFQDTPRGQIFPLAGTIAGATWRRDLTTIDADGVVVSFATADFFQCLVTHISVTLATRTKEIDDTEASPEFRAFWQKHDPAKPLVNVKPCDFDPTTTVAGAPIVILPRIFPLPCPFPFPPGIIASMKACANVNDLAKIISHYCDDSEESTSAWLGFCPLFYEWFHAACAHPNEFASTWMAKNWIQSSLSLTTSCRKWSPTFDAAPFRSQHPFDRSTLSIAAPFRSQHPFDRSTLSIAAPFRSQHVANLLKLLFLTVDWRVHLDILFATVCSNPASTLSKRFVCCLERGHLRAFSDPSPLGQVPWCLAGEQLAVRPPSIQSYWSTLGLAYFVDPGDDLPVNVRNYFVFAVDYLLSSSYTSTPF
jgi:hypothetical protein